MTTFDPADARAKIFTHLTNVDYFTAVLPDESDATMTKFHQAAEDFAEMIMESLGMKVVGQGEEGVLVEVRPLNPDALEDWLVSYAEQYEVSETLDG